MFLGGGGNFVKFLMFMTHFFAWFSDSSVEPFTVSPAGNGKFFQHLANELSNVHEFCRYVQDKKHVKTGHLSRRSCTKVAVAAALWSAGSLSAVAIGEDTEFMRAAQGC